MSFKEYCAICRHSIKSIESEPCASCIKQTAQRSAENISEETDIIEFQKNLPEPIRFERIM